MHMRDAGTGKARQAYAPITAGLLPLAVRGICVARQSKALLDGVTLTISGGAPTVIMGANGAGKSLLLRVMHGLVEPDAGTLVWGDGVEPGLAGRRSAMVFQKPTLLRRSVLANIEFVLAHRPRAAKRQSAGAILADAGLADRANTPARQLSGGEQQRLAMARALASYPEVLFLDEPTASLDPASTAAVEGMIARASEGGTKVVLVTHDIGQARRVAGEVVFLERGRVTETTKAAAFFAGPVSDAARAYLAGELRI
jgi:tungstate transport system ATP-binding protein